MAALTDLMQDHLHHPVIFLHSDISCPHIGKTEGKLPAESRVNKTGPEENAPPTER